MPSPLLDQVHDYVARITPGVAVPAASAHFRALALLVEETLAFQNEEIRKLKADIHKMKTRGQDE